MKNEILKRIEDGRSAMRQTIIPPTQAEKLLIALADLALADADPPVLAKVECHCGRLCSIVRGMALAVEGDPCRELGYPNTWDRTSLETVAIKLNS